MPTGALDATERRLLGEAKDDLIPFDPSLPSVMQRVLPRLARLTGAIFAGSYCPKRTTAGWDLDFGFGYLTNGQTQERAEKTRNALTRVIRSAPRGLATLARVPREEQNCVASLRTRLGEKNWEAMPMNQAILPALGLNIEQHDLRVLLAERGVLVAWLGVYGPQSFDARAHRLFQSLIPDLRKAAVAERILGRAALEHAALLTALEAIPTGAYLTNSTGRVVYANKTGRRDIDRARSDQRQKLALWIGQCEATGQCAEADITPLRVRDLALHYLVVERPPLPQVAHSISRARGQYGLTPRQIEILELVVQGDSNKVIATTLGASLRTVEHHVSELLRRVGVESRAALVQAVLCG